MRFLFPLFVIFLISHHLQCQSLPSFPSHKIGNWNSSEPIVKGAVKVSYKYFKAENGSLSYRPFSSIEEHIFKAGKLQKITFRHPLGDSISGIYHFDRKGRIKRQERVNKNAWWPVIKYFYDERRRISKEVCYQASSKIDEQTLIYYNENYLPIKKEVLDENHQLKNFWIYEYNSRWDLTKEIFINTSNGGGMTLDGSITGGASKFTPWPNDTTVYQLGYDNLNRLIVKKKYSNSKLKETLSNIFFQDSVVSTLTEFSRLDDKPQTITVTTEVGSKKVIRRNLIDLDGKTISSWTKFTYESGKFKEFSSYSFGRIKRIASTAIQSFTYDHKGNWIKKQTFENNQITGIVEREIEYQKSFFR
ncbi:hypothetical protein [Rufibacter roseus]|uniref:YD repeat-containing protein n=1 Tax=Rufibacter roseus TaxID=1567108 RepID=A0ABW2DKF0_9BACT|nr:hypothetical protein [Rufibacter roseus]